MEHMIKRALNSSKTWRDRADYHMGKIQTPENKWVIGLQISACLKKVYFYEKQAARLMESRNQS